MPYNRVQNYNRHMDFEGNENYSRDLADLQLLLKDKTANLTDEEKESMQKLLQIVKNKNLMVGSKWLHFVRLVCQMDNRQRI